MKKAALYVRVSTMHQIDKDSLPFQKQELSNYAKYALGIDDFELFEDAGYSAKNTDRPQYQDMMNRIRAKEFTHLLVWKIDRISRNLKDFTEMYDELKSRGIVFVSKNEQFDTSSAMGEAMLKIILVFAELERKLTGERVYSIMLSRAEKGLWNGATVPYGYTWDDQIKFPVIDPEESVNVNYIYDLYLETRSTIMVAERLTAERIRTKRDGKWTAKTIRDILRNPFYVGTYRYNMRDNKTNKMYKDEKEWIVVENNHPGIIDKSKFDLVGDILTINFKGQNTTTRQNCHTHIFAKLAFCGRCGNLERAGQDTPRKDGYRPSRYYCTRECNNLISDINLLPFILTYISNFINLDERITSNHSLRDIQDILLRGEEFKDIESIDKSELKHTFEFLINGYDHAEFKSNLDGNESTNIEFEKLKKEKQKYEKALERLQDLYLFSDESMSQKDFIIKKKNLDSELGRVNDALLEFHQSTSGRSHAMDTSFLKKACTFLVNQQLLRKGASSKDLSRLIDPEILRELMLLTIQKIIVLNGRVSSITFVNGITHTFQFKPFEKQIAKTRKKYNYLKYEDVVMNLFREKGSLTRKDIEAVTGKNRYTALAVINDFLEKGYIEKNGQSILIEYHWLEKGGELS